MFKLHGHVVQNSMQMNIKVLVLSMMKHMLCLLNQLFKLAKGKYIDEPISLRSDIFKGYLMCFSSWNLELRTIETVATVLYNSGADFVGLEIVDAKLRLLVGKGSNAVELIPDRNVSDGKWHNISISYSPINVEVSLW